MKRFLIAVALMMSVAFCSVAESPPVGFFVESAAASSEFEAVLLSTPAPARARTWLAALTEEPHVAGTAQEKVVAEYVRDRLADFGLETEIVTYEVYLSHPESVAVRIVQPVQEELSLMEESLAVDKDSAPATAFPGFHGYAASGSAAGEVVYVNYGTPGDYKKLESLGISVADRIVLVRYGQVFRGLKVREAEKRGARGVLIYSDPADDGYMKGDIYPDGPMRPPSAIQRGSVQYLSVQPGDPSTPGWPSREGARRVARDEMISVPKVPSLPIGYGEAEKILRLLGGPRVPDPWQGGLPFAYHVGPGGAVVEMDVEMRNGQMPIYNVFARIPGSEEPESLVIVGNHRDAWTHGAVDPNSGTATFLEAARGLAAAVEAGWKPRRTILLASWDAEEYGLVGSVEWGEDRAENLSRNAVAYVNIDSAVTGPNLGIGGSPSLRDLAREVAAQIEDPLEGGSVGGPWERSLEKKWADKGPVDLSRPDEEFELHLDALGSGSDYTVFLDHLGVPSLNLGFRGSYGVYHSTYDNFRWMEKFGDPQFVYHAAAARLLGLVTMRLGSADLVPMRFSSYAGALETHLEDLQRQVIRARRRPSSPGDTPVALEADFGPVFNALEEFGAAGADADRALDGLVAGRERDLIQEINAALAGVEREFLSEDGLPGRPWFKHLLYAPGLTTGYAAWPFPELAEAVENRDAELFAHGAQRVVSALNAASSELRRVSSMAGGV